MAARVALLILATVTFAVLWSGDHPDSTAAVHGPAPVIDSQPQQESSPQPAAGQVGSVPLPDFVTPGTFLVVDQFGRTQIRNVSEDDLAMIAGSRQTLASDHYTVEAGGTRWHYIRVERVLPAQAMVKSKTNSSLQ